jgi:natural product biosynthesis luciferase-like monooxygenase protein
LSLLFFGADAEERQSDRYALLLEAARFADAQRFEALWVPERHFQRFGGLYPSPSVMAAALAAVTRRIQLRAGSVVLPLQNPVRVAEEWSMIDNLSGGRAAIAIAAGWHVDDFVLNPPAYADRHGDVGRKLDVLQRLWKGEKVDLPNGDGRPIAIGIHPRPVQPQLPIWLTGWNPTAFELAGRLGHNFLTANFVVKHDPAALKERIDVYRAASLKHHGRPGTVTVMVHTWVGGEDGLERLVRPALRQYLATYLDIKERPYAVVHHARRSFAPLTEKTRGMLLEAAVNETLASSLCLFGSAERCRQHLEGMARLGIDEVACLLDFGVPSEAVLEGLTRLAELVPSA